MTENLSILGSTGSIGTQALKVAENLNIKISALTANSNSDLMEQQVRKFKPQLAVMFEEQSAKRLKTKIADTGTKVLYGLEGLCEAAQICEADTVLNSVVGMVGLLPTLTAADAKKNIALANKETLVTGGSIVMDAVKNNGVKLYPVDSEHSAIFQCLQGMPDKKAVKKLILTASGGPFFGKTFEEIENAAVEDALNHPNWNMGAKITIDSATMMNKGLEIIEASWLFNMPVDKIDVVVHRESVIHSMIEYVDNSVIAQMGVPDMCIPIQYALTYPKRVESYAEELNLCKISNLSFYEPDYETFTCLKACINAMKKGGLAPTAANSANEEAVKLFLQGKIKFGDIGKLVTAAMNNEKELTIKSVDDILLAEQKARQFVRAEVNL